MNAEASADDEPAPSWLRRLLWLALPAFASVLLLATTNHICLDVPAVPFLWVAPLSLYLLSFIIAFDHQRWYRRMPFALAALFTCYFTAILANPTAWGNWMSGLHGLSGSLASTSWLPMLGYWQSLCLQLAVLFLLSMLCHGELVRLRPSARYLTSFYLMISAGGALGGLSVSLIAPLVFTTYAEWKISLIVGFVLAAAVAFAVTDWTGSKRPTLNSRTLVRGAGIVASLIAFPDIVYMLQHEGPSRSTVLERTRDFYAVLTVRDDRPENTESHARTFTHGSTLHGMQFTDPKARQRPTTYFTEISGVGRTLQYYQESAAVSGKPLRVGVIGLGAGTLAAWISKPGQTIRFYEIDPEVYRLAEKYFTFLEDARARGAKVEVVLGDARLSLEHELARTQAFDVLVIDAFSSDSPPIHLLTKEAFELYRQHLAPAGGHRGEHYEPLPRIWHPSFSGWPKASTSRRSSSRPPISDRSPTVRTGSSCREIKNCCKRYAPPTPNRRPNRRRRCRCGPTSGTISSSSWNAAWHRAALGRSSGISGLPCPGLKSCQARPGDGKRDEPRCRFASGK